MAQPTITVKDQNGSSVTIFTINPNGQALGANSQPVVLASDNPVGADLIFNNESRTPLAASGTFTGAWRDIGQSSGLLADYCFFNAFVLASHAGIIRIESSPDAVLSDRVTADVAIVGGTPLFLKVQILTRYHRVVVVNGGTLQTAFVLNSGLSST
jgi:hypothetical protein